MMTEEWAGICQFGWTIRLPLGRADRAARTNALLLDSVRGVRGKLTY